MSGATMQAPAPARTAELRRLAWMHPEWWIVLAAAAAWIALAVIPHPAAHGHAPHVHAAHSFDDAEPSHFHAGHPVDGSAVTSDAVGSTGDARMTGGARMTDGVGSTGGARMTDGVGSTGRAGMTGGVGSTGGAGMFGDVGAVILRAVLMIVAMMLPLVLANVRHAALSSLSARRHRAIVGFVAGFLALWIPAQLLIEGAAAVLGSYAGWLASAGVIGLAAAAWEASPTRGTRLRRCHATAPLAPRGWRAHADCFRYGVVTGRHCVVSCWALMALCSAAGHALPVMGAVFALQWAGRDARWNALRWTAAVLVAVSVAGAGLLRA
jgi:predicted metal-binding membrane protein